jgi:hypothetical protein
MKKPTIKQLLKASDTIEAELVRLRELHDGGEYIISSAIGARILGISHQAMEDRIKKGSIQVYDSFGRNFLLGADIENQFDTRVRSLQANFENLGKYEESQVRKIIEFADSIKSGSKSIPRRPT